MTEPKPIREKELDFAQSLCRRHIRLEGAKDVFGHMLNIIAEVRRLREENETARGMVTFLEGLMETQTAAIKLDFERLVESMDENERLTKRVEAFEELVMSAGPLYWAVSNGLEAMEAMQSAGEWEKRAAELLDDK